MGFRETQYGMAVIVRQGLRDQVYDRLHEMIENSRFLPGARLNVEQLTAELGVSRTPIWQAVGRLEQEGLLRSVPNKGVYMVELSPAQALDIYSVREVLECMAADLAAARIDDGALAAMEENLASQRAVVEARDLVAYSKLDFDFHATVYKASGNEFLVEILSDIKKKMRPMVNHMTSVLEDLYHDHVAMVDALKRHDARGAIEGFRTHNERMKALILDAVGETQQEREQAAVAVKS
jgi:DNA-binding GntR family transcriptional regulator